MQEIKKTLEELPPSAKLVFKVLEYRGFLTQKEIAEETFLPPRTVRYALNRLKVEDFLQEKFYFKDARQSLYGLIPTLAKPMATSIPVQEGMTATAVGTSL
ncbi:transcription initiation factor IIE alpha subunit [Methanohalophilus levihalophilus]|uniref:winged helix-turn-helix transcriptional regulator n=1 Tax=Methanohalophilus levihalophilus TaxID=1431282 RepID=UPI001AE7424B|nr:winged helix-turn-helix transcriptional regulator [Methanohalophilus levihalophilus]MBP2031252.1 transcription initiation factor IIE alpha subunit [Methanohalophilus levihalophilus]